MLPFRKRSYPATPVSSVDGCHERVSDVAPTLEAATSVGADGGCVSAQAPVAAVSEERVERLPAASNASMPRV